MRAHKMPPPATTGAAEAKQSHPQRHHLSLHPNPLPLRFPAMVSLKTSLPSACRPLHSRSIIQDSIEHQEQNAVRHTITTLKSATPISVRPKFRTPKFIAPNLISRGSICSAHSPSAHSSSTGSSFTHSFSTHSSSDTAAGQHTKKPTSTLDDHNSFNSTLSISSTTTIPESKRVSFHPLVLEEQASTATLPFSCIPAGHSGSNHSTLDTPKMPSARRSIMVYAASLFLAPALLPSLSPSLSPARAETDTPTPTLPTALPSSSSPETSPDTSSSSSPGNAPVTEAMEGGTNAAPPVPKKKRRPADDDRGPPVLRRFNTPGGVRVEEVVVGQGDLEAELGDLVTFHYVCRRSNGYFVASTVDPLGKISDPIQLALGPKGQMIEGLTEVIQGMRPGGKRRALVPPEVGYVSTELQPLPQEYDRQRALFAHSREPLIFEVRLMTVRRGDLVSRDR